MSRKIQQQFLFSNLRRDANNKGQAPIKITEKKFEREVINLNSSFSDEFSNMPKEENVEEDNNNKLAQSYSFNQINRYREKILNEPSTIILESLIYSKQNGGKKNINKNNKFITSKDVSNLFTKLLNKNKESQEEYLKLRNIYLNEDELKSFQNNKFKEKEMQKLYSQILKVNYSLNKFIISNNVNPIFSLNKLFEEITLTNPNISRLNYKEKYNKLKPIVYRCRKIKGDGNCYYRAVMFRYFERIILGKNLILLKKIILEMNQAFKSKEIKDRLYIKMDVNFKPELHIKIMYLILDLLENEKVRESYDLFIKCILCCAIFDYGLILYFRYILYLYIKENEKKLYSKEFPVKVGNFLPEKYENEKGEFEFQKFYSNYLLKMFTEAEKIIIYLTPFVLGINLDIIIFEDNEDKIVKRFSYEEENGDNKFKDNVITLLNRNAHYELVYTYDDYNKYSNYYKNYEIVDKLNDEKISGDSFDKNFFLLESNLNNYNKTSKTMVHQPKNFRAEVINNNTQNRLIIIKKKQKNISNIKSNNLAPDDNGSKFKNTIKIIHEENKPTINNLINKDNNGLDIEKQNSKDINENSPQQIIKKTEDQIPFGHPEYKSDDFKSYLDEIDNMFLNNIKYVVCIKCKAKETNLIHDEYEFCSQCLKNETINSLAKDYSDYLKNKTKKTKDYKISFIKLDKYTLSIKNILEILKLYTEISEEKQIYPYIKQFVCIYCLKTIDLTNNLKVIFPCGCALCNKDELEKYFTEQNIVLSDNYICLCGHKYQSEEYFLLAEECNRVGSECICLMVINIFNKDILSKGCCGCGSNKKDIVIKYKNGNDANNNLSFETYLNANKISLVHYFCKKCKERYNKKVFICKVCNKIHILINE